ncbi:MAG TPA: DUF378 domain-containing protein [Candidatus Fermentibacter daniensis]|nr:DUF378 domain-containing protein [Candidatus Fermentibacter daniensis]HOZ17407.1 DUF378 domain-containing protein [Candidatus Fermentibacter daniensis]HPH39276.1 DUF378 domain-containing protein [Candidatus Fermentibacter daniensis]HPN63296.1 DUF378 domain-containing protein [Candidatus Fermentibacter daniensis]HQE57349.1 DUF378 domain-containing protein [Candidatus Fermentibacter daniensis]
MGSIRLGFFDRLALILSVTGAIDWGLVGILKKELFSGIIGLSAGVATIIYVIIGVAGVWSLIFILPRTGK